MEHERDTRIETLKGGDQLWWKSQWREVLNVNTKQGDWVRVKVDADNARGEREFIFRPGFFVAAKVQVADAS